MVSVVCALPVPEVPLDRSTKTFLPPLYDITPAVSPTLVDERLEMARLLSDAPAVEESPV
jgi:hypothetical protein